MRLSLLLLFLPIIVNAKTDGDVRIENAKYYEFKEWQDRISHPSHKIPRPMPAPTLIRSWSAVEQEIPNYRPMPSPTTERPIIIEPTPSVIIVPNPPRPTTPTVLPPVTIAPNNNYPRPVLPPRPIPRPIPIPVNPPTHDDTNIIDPKSVPKPTPVRPLPPRPVLPPRPTEAPKPLVVIRPKYPTNVRPPLPARPIPKPSWNGIKFVPEEPKPIIPHPIIPPSTPTSDHEYFVTEEPQPIIPDPKPNPPIKPPPSPTPTYKPDHEHSRPAIIDNPEVLAGFSCKAGNGYYLFANECDTYVECKSNVAIKYMCPDGLHFNPKTVYPEYPCGYPSEVKCDSRVYYQAPKPTKDCPRQYGYFPLNDGDCSRYLMCQEGLATIMDCPAGLVFNDVLSSCDWPENVPQCQPGLFQGFTCPAPKDVDGRISDFIYKYRYGKSCKEYVACQRGYPRLLSCNPGLYFDEVSERCVDADFVKNCDLTN